MSHRAFIYTQDFLPLRTSTGTYSRIYSNVRAYLDLGYEVEVVYFQTKPDRPFTVDESLGGVKWTHVPACGLRGSQLDRLCYQLGRPLRRALSYRFKTSGLVVDAVRRREASHPGSIHQFEQPTTACAVIWLPRIKGIWSLHDIESNFYSGHHAIRREIEGRRPRRSELRELGYLEHAERLAAARMDLVLCIALHEREALRREWGCEHAEFFPMSIPSEEAPTRTRPWVADGRLRILHIGRVDSLPSFRSLQFLLDSVFPLLSPDELNRVELLVVGEVRDSQRARALQERAAAFPHVVFTGYQADSKGIYAGVDLQAVGSTEATGLRTRIVESFAYGVPVISTTVGAAGVEGLKSGENIILADDPERFAQAIRDLVDRPGRLQEIAEAGRRTYDLLYSRSAVAAKLSQYLTTYFGSQAVADRNLMDSRRDRRTSAAGASS